MYLVLMLENNRPIYAKVFATFDAASDHADDLVMNLRGVTNEMPDWEGGEVYEHDGYGSETVIVTGCHDGTDTKTPEPNRLNDWMDNAQWFNYNNKNKYKK